MTEESEFSLRELIEERAQRARYGGVYKKYFNTASTQQDYPKHHTFFTAGKTHRQRLFRAANRVGKTTGAGAELVYHLTGIYPAWWDGKRFDGCTSWWVCGKSTETVRQILQPLLLGEVGDFGTGLIPAELLDHASLTDAKKASTGISTFRVKHTCGTYSQVEFKSYESGRSSFEGTARSIWLDEECPEDIYAECLLRTMTGDNIFMFTFTPLRGATAVVLSFSRDGNFEEGTVGVGKHVTTATWDDVVHLDEDAKRELLASIPPYQRDARSKGIPALGAGAIYAVQEEQVFCDPFELPRHWKRCFGLDVGWSRTAAVWGAIDPESNILYLYSEHYLGEAVPSTHAAAIRARGEWIPGVIDPASRGRTQDDGNQLMQNYIDLGLDVEKANNNVESAIWEILEALQQGRIKVFNTLINFRREYRSYNRDEKGKIVKSNDHLLDAFRYLWNSGRDRAKTEQEATTRNKSAMSGLPTRSWNF